MKAFRASVFSLGLIALACGRSGSRAAAWDNFADTWTATDGLGRRAPGFAETGPARPDRTIGIFYFLWLGPHSQQGGPWDIGKIVAQDPSAMQKPDSPLWGPMFAPHHWGESVFGYYNSDDPYVLRKHAQMLGDAGVDVVIFDVTNQATYRSNYLALLREWAAVRALGNRTPQIAFLCPFWNPDKVVRELYRDLYRNRIEPGLWFQWEGKPLILADPDKLHPGARFAGRDHPAELAPGHSLGQSLLATNSFSAVGGAFPTWQSSTSSMTLRLRRDGPGGAIVTTQRFRSVDDNAWAALRFPPQPAGAYYLEMIEPEGRVGWWSHGGDRWPGGRAYADGLPAAGDRNLEIAYGDAEEQAIQEFFTFRRPQPDYFRGQTAPDMWSWLEVYPQHVFTNAAGAAEQISAGVAQNAVGGRLGSMSERGARGRSWHGGRQDPRPGAVGLGLNFAEQFGRALAADPRFIFITGWNEWIAGRHPEFNGIREPVMFVDQFDQEHSRDIEPMRGGHGDNYYYQMTGFIRRYKGVRPPPAASPAKTISIAGPFSQWAEVRPEYRDDLGDILHRDFPGYANHRQYTNDAGRNDIVCAKTARDGDYVYFYVRTREPLSPPGDPTWMWLLIDADDDPSTGWAGFDLLANRAHANGQPQLERTAAGWNWTPETVIARRIDGNEMHLAIPIRAIPGAGKTLRFNFKWADRMPEGGSIVSWLEGGDTAPNARFTYHFEPVTPGAPASPPAR